MARSMVARQGRDKQRYTEDGSRVVAGTIVLNQDRSQVLVVSSVARPNHYVLPKGGAELDETLEEAAQRETWEEAGAVCEIDNAVGEFHDMRPPKHWPKDKGPAPARSVFHIFEASLVKLEDEYPESHKRQRKWMTFEQAKSDFLAHERFSLVKALEASSMVR